MNTTNNNNTDCFLFVLDIEISFLLVSQYDYISY